MGAVPSTPDLSPCIPASAPQIWSSVRQQQPSQTSPTTTADSPLQTLSTSSAPNLCPSEIDHSPSHWSWPPLPN
ncbi:hypothetical protein I3760_01G044200 [Carya illinoinensis]|nr:hypothetical protein I3760_01G044200 [Carya illinoinensis]